MRQNEENVWRLVEQRSETQWSDREVIGTMLHTYAEPQTCRRCGDTSLTAWIVLFRDYMHNGMLLCEHCLQYAGWYRKEQNKGKRRGIRPSDRFRVMQAAGERCFYCRRHKSQLEVGEFLHVDHKVPVKDGGTNDIGNLVCSCSTCNIGKGALTEGTLPEGALDEEAAA